MSGIGPRLVSLSNHGRWLVSLSNHGPRAVSLSNHGPRAVSIEMITIIVSVAALLVTLAGMFIGSFAWLLRRMDDRFDKVDQRFESLAREIVEVKIALARIEGPQRRLIAAR